MVCEIPFETLDDLSGKMPNLRQQMMRLMSGEIKGDQDMILLLSKKNAEERLAAFIYNLSRRFAQRGFSPREFRLTMTRGDIGNYLGLTVETISRLLGRFQKSGMIYDFSYEMTTLLSPDERTAMRQGVISQRSAWIREQAKYYIEAGIPLEIKVVWHNRPFEAIIQEVISAKHDLVLKMAHQHDRLEAVIFTPTDWHLLRKCPSPVWMVKDQPWPEGGKALVAVNLASEEAYHNALNEKLVKETLQLAEQVNHTEVHLVGAYPVTPINIAIELPEFDPSVYNDAIRGQHLLAMKALRQKFSIDEKVTHVEKGLPEEVIPDLAEHLQAGIVVLGTVGRTGISAAFLGNTAEQVIDHLRCDLLVIKPDEYQTPVELDDEEDD